MFPSKGRIVFVVLSSGDVVSAVVRKVKQLEVDVTAFPDTGPEALRLNGLQFSNEQLPLTWHWPPRV